MRALATPSAEVAPEDFAEFTRDEALAVAFGRLASLCEYMGFDVDAIAVRLAETVLREYASRQMVCAKCGSEWRVTPTHPGEPPTNEEM